MKIAVIGHSHILSIREAAQKAKVYFNNEVDTVIDTLWFGDYKDFRVRDELYGIDGFSYEPQLRKDILKIADGVEIVFLCIGGRAHIVLGLAQHPRPYDFILPFEPSLPLKKGIESVPSKIVIDSLLQQGNFVSSIWFLKATKAILNNKKLCQIQSPPPLGQKHVLQHPGAFLDVITKYGVNQLQIRYKYWRLHSQLFEAECKALGIDYINSPASMVDAQFALLEKASKNDPTHANHIYGLKLIEQIIQLKSPSFRLPDQL